MRAVFAAGVDGDNPLSMLRVGDQPPPDPPDGWTVVKVLAAAVNQHDLWSLRGVGLSGEKCPMILGCDAAGIDANGDEVIVHAVIADPSAGGGDETRDAHRTLLTEGGVPGTLAEYVAVPRRNVIPKPPVLSFMDSSCLPTAWLTAYRMLTTRGRLPQDGSVLVQGIGGGVATAAIMLARALGARVYATSANVSKRIRAAELGAVAIKPGGRLPERVDVVVETVGAATLDHSLKCAKPGGRVVIAGATSGYLPTVNLRRVFFSQLELIGSTMGTRDELKALAQLLVQHDIRPVIDSVYPLTEAPRAFARLAGGAAFGKVVLEL